MDYSYTFGNCDCANTIVHKINFVFQCFVLFIYFVFLLNYICLKLCIAISQCIYIYIYRNFLGGIPLTVLTATMLSDV